MLTQETSFDFDRTDILELVTFLREVRQDKVNRRNLTGTTYLIVYEPMNPDLEKLRIQRLHNGRAILMALSTAWKLLDGLTGKTERLVEEGQK